jgi:hypothetical protein
VTVSAAVVAGDLGDLGVVVFADAGGVDVGAEVAHQDRLVGNEDQALGSAGRGRAGAECAGGAKNMPTAAAAATAAGHRQGGEAGDPHLSVDGDPGDTAAVD